MTDPHTVYLFGLPIRVLPYAPEGEMMLVSHTRGAHSEDRILDAVKVENVKDDRQALDNAGAPHDAAPEPTDE